MISKEEIQEIASQKQLAINVIEKDYMLGWILAGIHHHPLTKDTWVFKGGTCLKKCYFETFRFSEDLDFTYRGKNHEINADFYKNLFIEISHWIYDEAGIELPEQGIEFEIFENNRHSLSVQGKLSYRGIIQPNQNIQRLPRIKIDLTLDEPLFLKPVIKAIDHPYSDKSTNGKRILAYTYEEIFAEKLRALVQRLRPRDLYDVIHLYWHQEIRPDLDLLRQILQKKCDIRLVPYPTIQLIETHHNRKLLESEWAIQLKHQVSNLQPVEIFLNELEKIFEWLSLSGDQN
jgi:predicted nucleotidyltransferase component of viral defense system